MARSQDQKRWRENSDKQRVEVYLPAKMPTSLDVLASEHGASRAGVIAQLFNNQRQTTPRSPEQGLQLA